MLYYSDGCESKHDGGRRENREMSCGFGFIGRWWHGGGSRIGRIVVKDREGRTGKDGRWGDRGTEEDIK